MDHVLLVEDDASHAKLARRSFDRSEAKLQLTVCDSLNEATKALRARPWNLVMADLILPDGRGTDLLNYPDTLAAFPLVVLTSHGDEKVAVDALKAGALDYVVKTDSTLMELPHVAERALREWHHIQARQQAELELRESEARFRQIVETSQEGIWTVDSRHQTSFVNRKLTEMLGYAATDMRTRPLTDFVHPADRETATNLMRRPGGKPVELRFCRRSGEDLWTRLSTNMIHDDQGDCVGTLLMVADITEHREAEDELRQRELQLAHVARVSTMGELVAELAHEVNQPLYAIANTALGCSKTLERNGPLDVDKLRTWVDSINRQAQRAGAIIRRIRNFMQRTGPERSPASLNEIIRESIELLAADAKQRQIQSGFSPQRDFRVSVSRVEIQQVLANLLQNAYDALRDVPTEHRLVTVTTSGDDEFARVQVADRGSGIDGDAQPHVFDAFFTTKQHGLGMGLAVCRTIIQTHGGSIEVQSSSQQGTQFTFTLPICQPQ